MATEPDIGTKIRRARERKRMSQKQLAAALGVSRSAVNAWENNRALPQSSVGALEAELGCSLDDAAPAAPDPMEELRAAMRRVEELTAQIIDQEKGGTSDHRKAV